MTSAPWLNFAVALGIGLLVGLERERVKGEGPARRSAGIRTFALAAVLGAIAMYAGGVTLLAVAEAGVLALAAFSHARSQDPDPGVTTEVGLLATPLLGGLAMSDMILASGLAAIVAAVFAAKAPLHRFVRRVLTDAEVHDAVVFAVATLVIWPQLPDRYLGPLQALNPYNIWLLVILMLALGACGHIATRAFGARLGLPIAGLASGFVSSAATVGAMASRAAKDPASLGAAVAGAAFSTVATFVLLGVLLATTSPPTFVAMAPSLVAGAVVATIHGLAFAMRDASAETKAAPDAGRAFSVGTALALAAVMAAMLLAAAWLRSWLGETGVIAGAVVAGFVDAHATSISVASLVASARMTPQAAVMPILLALSSNTVAKIVMAAGAGAPGFVLRIAPGLVLATAAAWAAAVPMLLR